MTRDVIHIANYTIVRTWDAGSAVIKPKVVVKQNGNVINYLLDFSTQNNFVKPPSWLNHSMTYNKYASITWFYLEQNASLAHALHEYIMKTINSNDKQYWKFEYFVLASEFVMYTFNTTYSVYNNMLELESFYVNWSTLPSKILNLSVWPNRTYSLGVLMFFNVSRIPQIYNVTNYFNITGNYEVYLTDIYNGLDYNKWDRVPFGNTYYFYNPIINETVYFYLNDSNLPVPYLHEDLYFESTNYVTDVYYITFQYSAPLKEEITAIWNGTTWET
ncbi:MAG: hypothetical protein JHC26_05550 [Thermofilum sp.]|nr:hypothetical protein [Thermofilum sp.]